MVNELSYCPRLFFFEWVQARFADNTNTVEGRYHHRSVDRQEGGCPAYEAGREFDDTLPALSPLGDSA